MTKWRSNGSRFITVLITAFGLKLPSCCCHHEKLFHDLVRNEINLCLEQCLRVRVGFPDDIQNAMILTRMIYIVWSHAWTSFCHFLA